MNSPPNYERGNEPESTPQKGAFWRSAGCEVMFLHLFNNNRLIGAKMGDCTFERKYDELIN